MPVSILCIGDLVGKAGRSVLAEHLPGLIRDRNIDFVVCNGENAAGGSGLTPQIFQKLRHYGVDVVTLGDHCFRKGDILSVIETSERLIRPANFAPAAPGRGWTVVAGRSGRRIGVACVAGQLNMGNHDSPWASIDRIFREMPEDVRIRIVDMHAETTSEKIAMGWHCNGRASIVFGTHTHVPTADLEVLDKGTAFISDLGMTGPYDSVLGRRKDRVLKFLTTGMPQKFEVAVGDPRSYTMLVEVDETTGKALAVEQIVLRSRPPADGPYDADDARPGR
jgi:metallophosphoesterase (TIGR00282 family)